MDLFSRSLQLTGPLKLRLIRSNSSLKSLTDDDLVTMETIVKGTVQLFANKVKNDWSRPWSKMSPKSSTGSGFILSLARRLIITNAHVVSFASTLQIRKDGDFDKHKARILYVCHEADLAALFNAITRNTHISLEDLDSYRKFEPMLDVFMEIRGIQLLL